MKVRYEEWWFCKCRGRNVEEVWGQLEQRRLVWCI